jgi:hypothetical protein
MAKTTTTVKEINELFPNLKTRPDLYIKVLEDHVDMYCEQIQDWKDFIDRTQDKWRETIDSFSVEKV